MSTRIPRLALATESIRTEAIAGATVPELAATAQNSEQSSIGRLCQRLKTDEQLARDLQSGNADALTELFRRHCGPLFHIARRIVGSAEEAEDVVQQIFLDVFRSIHQFDSGKGSFKTWLFLFAYHRAFNHRRTMIAGGVLACCPLDDDLPTPICDSSPAEVRVLVDQALSQLPARERRTIELVYFRGLTATEASVATRETVRVVRHNLYRGLAKLREILAAPDPRKSGKGAS